jgi:hypothetical protein
MNLWMVPRNRALNYVIFNIQFLNAHLHNMWMVEALILCCESGFFYLSNYKIFVYVFVKRSSQYTTMYIKFMFVNLWS